MQQHLIVEGKDYYFIGTLCRKHFGRPIGFTKATEKEFLKGGNGYDKTLNTFIDAFDNPDMTKDYCKFTEFKQQKAIIYNWLAWQQSPGLPFGTALEAGFLSAEKASLQPFLNWIGRSFQF